MDRKWKFGGLVVLALVPLLIAASGGFPSRPRFSAVGVNAVTPATGNLTASGTITAATINATTALQLNGTPIALASGTFAMTQTGCAGGASSPTVRYVQTGRVVTLELPTVACTSNATSWSWTGIPAAQRPAGGWSGVPLGCILNNSVQECGNGAAFIDSTGAINFSRNGNTSGWTNTGSKNVGHFTSITYGVL